MASLCLMVVTRTPRETRQRGQQPHERALQSCGEGIDGAVVEGARWPRLQGGRRAYSVRLHGAPPPPISTTPSDLSLCHSILIRRCCCCITLLFHYGIMFSSFYRYRMRWLSRSVTSIRPPSGDCSLTFFPRTKLFLVDNSLERFEL